MFDRLKYKSIGRNVAANLWGLIAPMSFIILFLTGEFLNVSINQNIDITRFISARDVKLNMRLMWIHIEISVLFFLIALAALTCMRLIGAVLKFGEKAFYMYTLTYKPDLDPAPNVHMCYSYSAAYFYKFLCVHIIMVAKIILWSMLFIVPGIIKFYEYRLIPYIIASNPDMSYDEAQAISAAQMNGRKFDLFVMDLSFLGWLLLNALTAGILNAVWLRAYMEASYAAFFLSLDHRGYALPDSFRSYC